MEVGQRFLHMVFVHRVVVWVFKKGADIAPILYPLMEEMVVLVTQKKHDSVKTKNVQVC